MNTDTAKGYFQDAVNCLHKGLKVSGLVGNTPRKMLDFVVEGQEYRIIEANPDKTSPVAKLAQQGHEIYHVKDVDSDRLVGAIDLTDNNKWIPYDNTQVKPFEIYEIQTALQQAGEKTMGAASGMSRR